MWWDDFIRYLASHWGIAKTLIVTTGFLLGLAVLFLIGAIRAGMRFRRRGYRVRYIGPGKYVYEERAVLPASEVRSFWHQLRTPTQISFGTCNQLAFHGGPKSGSFEVELPPEERWNDQVPLWAQGRRAEILDRIAECFRVQEEQLGNGRVNA